MRKRFLATCLLLLTSLAASGLTQELSVETLLENHIAALGGVTAIESLNNLRIELSIVEPGFTVRGDYRAARDGRVRIDVFAGENRVFSEGIDAIGGWQQQGSGSAIEGMSEAGQAAMRAGVENNLMGLLHTAERGHTLRSLGSFVYEDIDYYRLQLIRADGFERHYFINPNTWLIDYTRETSALHPDIDPEEKPVESYYSDYQRVCAVMRSHQTQTLELESRQEIQRSQIERTQCNLPDGELALQRPGPGL